MTDTSDNDSMKTTTAPQAAQRFLYGYWRSSASYRVRIALNLKGLDYQHRGVNLLNNEQRNPDFLAKNPQGLIPLYTEERQGQHINIAQSLAILEYLDEAYPQAALLPSDTVAKAKTRAAAQIIACEIHPLDNLRVLQYLQQTLGVDEDNKMAWYRHWIISGFTALEAQLADLLEGKPFSLGERPGYLEALIVPQVYNAKRFNCPLGDFPRLVALDAACQRLSAFINAAPENQPDA